MKNLYVRVYKYYHNPVGGAESPFCFVVEKYARYSRLTNPRSGNARLA